MSTYGTAFTSAAHKDSHEYMPSISGHKWSRNELRDCDTRPRGTITHLLDTNQNINDDIEYAEKDKNEGLAEEGIK